MERIGSFKRVIVLFAVLLALFLSACGSNPGKLIVGTWVRDSNTNVDYTFAKDGSCDASFFYSAAIISGADQYKVEKDGTLVLQNTLAPAEAVFEKADTEEEALEDTSKYFVSEDTLIIEGETYTRSE